MEANTTAYSLYLLPQLTPETNSRLLLFAFILIGTLGAIIWDILSNLAAEYRLLREFRLRPTTFAYFLSRISTLAGFILVGIISTQLMEDCRTVLYAISWVFAVSVSSTTLMFFFRVRAVYHDNKYVIIFFFVMWLGVVGGSIVEIQIGTSKATHGQSTDYCIDDQALNLVTLVTAMSTIPMVNGVLIFCAVTLRLYRNSHVATSFKNGMRVVLFGDFLPAFSRALLKDSQTYFLSTVTLAIVTTATFYSPSIPTSISCALVFPNLALMSLMGCRIYRHTKLEYGTLNSSQLVAVSLDSIAFHEPAISNRNSARSGLHDVPVSQQSRAEVSERSN